MLKLEKICKEYVTGDLHQVALDNVSITFRNNEFAAVLGPSGSGKSTLLNIIGGLDRYDSGDLIIDDVSTKKYTDRDWDSYRNHSVGFVFQSYNLIPHQTILSNVELALTISGVGKLERRRRAKEALEKVGLGDHIHKIPNQMSGGQVQRVAIARALVNDPDILLADEPTGALDTKTSIQIMELLEEVAKDRLVIMVTHNPDLAEQYAERIIQLKDGKVISDTKKYRPRKKEEATHRNMGKSYMSFLTSLSLSFNNLKTKMGRTILTAFAGSIGIVGIALILALSNGVNTYIRNVQEDTLSEYPITVFKTGMDLSSLVGETMGLSGGENQKSSEVKETRLLESFLSGTSANDMKSFKKFLDENQTIQNSVNSIEYSYAVTPIIYKSIDEDDIRKVNPDETFSTINGRSPIASLLSIGTSGVSQFNEMTKEKKLYEETYTVMEGRWPEEYNEMVVVLTPDGNVSDYALYLLGLKDIRELDELLEKYLSGEDIVFEENNATYKYEDFIGREFTLVDVADLYEYDFDHSVYVDKSNNKDTVKQAVAKGEPLTIVGVVKSKGEGNTALLPPGVCYLPSLTEKVMLQAQDSALVNYQLNNPDINIFTGKNFGEENDPFNLEDIFSINEDQLKEAFKIDFSALDLSSSSFKGIDFTDVDFDITSHSIDLDGLSQVDFAMLLKDVNIKVNYPGLQEAFNDVTYGYVEWAKNDPATNYSRLATSVKDYMSSDRAMSIIRNHVNSYLSKAVMMAPTHEEVAQLISDYTAGLRDYIVAHGYSTLEELDEAIAAYKNSDAYHALVSEFIQKIVGRYNDLRMGDDDIAAISRDLYEDYEAYARENYLPQPSKLIDSFQVYIQTPGGREVFNNGVRKAVNVDEIASQLENNITSVMQIYSDEIGSYVTQMMSGFTDVVAKKMESGLREVMTSMQNVFYFNPNAFSNAINVNMDSDSMSDLIMSMATSGQTSYLNNLQKLNYATEDDPSRIRIYPKDFEAKQVVAKQIETYNKEMEESEQPEKRISYSDAVATLMGSVTKIVDTVSYILIAFVAISLVVSSIMIGIITYISVLERTKEIGILRALGASKHNISEVFNAETFIIGFLAGILGILVSYFVIIPATLLIHKYVNPGVTPALKLSSIVGLIGLSIILTLIGGLIPAKSAAKQDPVAALRTE